MSGEPILTIAIPTYRRVDLLERCLKSLRPRDESAFEQLEIVVSDNSPEDDVENLVNSFTQTWPGTLRYYRNAKGTGAVDNFNLCIDRASSVYTLILHDDDYLLPGAVDLLIKVLLDADSTGDQAMLFGVRVESLSGKALRHQRFANDVRLRPPEAYDRLLGNSSFVRTPGLVVRTDAYRSVGHFRPDMYTVCDFDMSVRLFGRFGVRCVPHTIAAYTVHQGGITTTVFNRRTVELIEHVFETAERFDILDPRRLLRLKRDWFHQFVLAGTWRALKNKDLRSARRILKLLRLPSIRQLGWRSKWLPVRLAFSVAVFLLYPVGTRLWDHNNADIDRSDTTW